MKRVLLISLAALALPVLTLQKSGVNLLQEASDLSYALMRSYIIAPAIGKYTERGLVAYGPRLNDRQNHYYRIKKYTVENGKIIPFQEQKAKPLDDQPTELLTDVPEFDEPEKFVQEPEEFVYEDEGLGAVPEIGEIDLEDLEEEKKKEKGPSGVEFGGFNL